MVNFNNAVNLELTAMAARLGQLLYARQLKIAVAESCTGGMISAVLTEIAGSSVWFERGFVTYSNASKMQLLGVQAQTLATFGAVSSETALEMVSGALQNSEAACAIAVTGIAGPSGGTLTKPVGTVFIAWVASGQQAVCERFFFEGDRCAIRNQSAARALTYWLEHFNA